jgi:hypothetical protein
MPLAFQKACSNDNDCGVSSTEPCALRATILAAANVSGAYSKTACAALLKPGSEDHWYFISFRLDAGGMHDVRGPFASHAWFSKALQDCAVQGWAPRSWYSNDLPAGLKKIQGIPVETKSFGYIPSAEKRQDVAERLVRLTFPKFADLSGDLAVRLVVTREGEVLEKQLLYASDATLGQRVLENLDAGLNIEKTGRGGGSGPFVDIFGMKFQEGELKVLLETNHALPSR